MDTNKDYSSPEFFDRIDALYVAAYDAVKALAEATLNAVAAKAEAEGRKADGSVDVGIAQAILAAGADHVERTLDGIIRDVGISLLQEALAKLGAEGETLADQLGLPDEFRPSPEQAEAVKADSEEAAAAAAVTEAERILYEAGE